MLHYLWSILVWVFYVLNFILAIFVFGWSFQFVEKNYNFVRMHTTRSQRYGKTGFELGCMELMYRIMAAGFFAILTLFPSLLVVDLRSDDVNVISFINASSSSQDSESIDDEIEQNSEQDGAGQDGSAGRVTREDEAGDFP